MRRPVLVTGANSGIGLATTMRLAQLGFPVIGSARTPDKAKTIHDAARRADVQIETVVMDVADKASYEDVVADLDLWGLVNNAGYMNAGTIEDVDINTVRRQFEAMVFAPMRIAALALPAMRQRGEGRIVNVSSATVHADGPLIGWYTAAKQALATLTHALRLEVAGWGIDVIGVEPGGFKTSIWDKAEADLQRERGSTTPHLYGIGRQVFQTLRPRMGDPADVARVIGEALQAGQPRRTYKVGWDAWGLAATAHLVPDRLRDRLVRTATRPGRERGIP